MPSRKIRKFSGIFPEDQFLTSGTVSDVADALGLSRRRVEQLQAAGKLPRMPHASYNIGLMVLLNRLRDHEGFTATDPEAGLEITFDKPRKIVINDQDEPAPPVKGIVTKGGGRIYRGP